jgi:uncharacterized phiE125 gp8 family phage protein
MRSLRVLTAATVEPVTLEEAKLHLRVDTDAEDTMIQSFISAARDYCERETGIALASQTLEYTTEATDYIFLPLAPVTLVESVVSVFEGVERDLVEGTDYWLDIQSMPAQINKLYQYEDMGIIRVVYDVAAQTIPPLVKSALL